MFYFYVTMFTHFLGFKHLGKSVMKTASRCPLGITTKDAESFDWTSLLLSPLAF